ncbi:MAG: M20/M25/M40 family metallo-hydrolase [Verrucomicrobia bacterium]|nr:M20/M25/M40 family metallo-hydrolase [Verrucomicrobiota bacterium]
MIRVLWLSLLLSVSACAQEWKELFDGKSLSGWMKAPFGGSGDVEVDGGVLVLHQGLLTGVNYTNPTPLLNYEVEIEARRVVGNDFFCGLTFPVKDSFATLILGGWGGSVIGVSSLDGNDAAHNETTQHRRFEAGRWYRIRLQVTAEALTVWLDDDQLFKADIRGKKISLRPGDIELSKPFGVATYSTTAEYRKIRIRDLKPAQPPPGAGGKTNAYQVPAELKSRLVALVAAATNSPEGFERLAYLCDAFGARPTGSTNLRSAVDWILDRMSADGLSSVRGEPVEVSRWIRGAEACELRLPQVERLPILGLGGTVPTPAGGLTAPVLVVTNFLELQQRSAEAHGRIVVFNSPFTGYGDAVRYRWSGAVAAAQAGAVASLIRSVTPFSLRTPHTGAMKYDESVPAIPHAALAPEDAERLARWQARGVTPVLHLNLENQRDASGRCRNVLAELKGREFPDEVIVLGGHVDSWDVGQGAQDDAGGCIAAWEAVRLMQHLKLQPRRTLRVVLWTNEESGLAGAKGYRAAHRHELARHVAAIESDSGTFSPTGFGFTGSEAGGAVIRGILEVLEETLGAGKFTLGAGEADLGPLMEEGVPALGLRTAGDRYFWVHHSDADTVDKVSPVDLARCTACLAVMAFALADLDFPLPR